MLSRAREGFRSLIEEALSRQGRQSTGDDEEGEDEIDDDELFDATPLSALLVMCHAWFEYLAAATTTTTATGSGKARAADIVFAEGMDQ